MSKHCLPLNVGPIVSGDCSDLCSDVELIHDGKNFLQDQFSSMPSFKKTRLKCNPAEFSQEFTASWMTSCLSWEALSSLPIACCPTSQPSYGHQDGKLSSASWAHYIVYEENSAILEPHNACRHFCRQSSSQESQSQIEHTLDGLQSCGSDFSWM